MTTTRPSEIMIGVPPLTGTLGRSEREAAAEAIVMTLARGGNEWRPVNPREVAQMVRADLAENPNHSLWNNPFIRPDYHDLVKHGFARWTNGEPPRCDIELTEEAIGRLQKWRRKPDTETPRSPSTTTSPSTEEPR